MVIYMYLFVIKNDIETIPVFLFLILLGEKKDNLVYEIQYQRCLFSLNAHVSWGNILLTYNVFIVSPARFSVGDI